MAMQTKHKRRGSTLTLILMLVVLIGLVAAIIFWPVEAKAAAMPTLTEQDDLEETTLVRTGDIAPDFTVKMTTGEKVTLSSLRGKVVLVTFWATWCPPCRQELAHMQEGVIDHFAGSDLVVLPISRGETRATVEAFINKMGYTFPVGLDENKSIYLKYATNYIPRAFVIDKKGKVVYSAAGYDDTIAREINEAISAALR